MKKILIFISSLLIISILLSTYCLLSIDEKLTELKPQKSYYVYEWREISTHRWSDSNKSIIVDSWERKGDADWEKKAWEEIRSVDLDGWEYAGTLLSSAKSIIILVKKRVADV